VATHLPSVPSFLTYHNIKKTLKPPIKTTKTYNSGYSLVVTYLTTNPPVRCLNRAERTGSLTVSCPATTKTVKMSVYSIARRGTRFDKKRKPWLGADNNSTVLTAKRSTNFSHRACTLIVSSSKHLVYRHQHESIAIVYSCYRITDLYRFKNIRVLRGYS
jgi:hypothetical protein